MPLTMPARARLERRRGSNFVEEGAQLDITDDRKNSPAAGGACRLPMARANSSNDALISVERSYSGSRPKTTL